MSQLTINATTHGRVGAFVHQPAHALLLHGRKGVGLKTLAVDCAQRIGSNAIIHYVDPDEKGTITIETIRGLYSLTRTHRDTPLVIIIDDAESMGREAQNALLKLLEEPTPQVFFVLTSHYPQLLLSTIASRMQHIEVLPVSREQSTELLGTDLDPTIRTQILFLAEGLPAELARLQTDETYRLQRIKVMKDARGYVQADVYGRLILSTEYSGDRVMALQFLEALSSLLMFMALEKQQVEAVQQLEAIETIREHITRNAHVKTQLAYLATVFQQPHQSVTM